MLVILLLLCCSMVAFGQSFSPNDPAWMANQTPRVSGSSCTLKWTYGSASTSQAFGTPGYQWMAATNSNPSTISCCEIAVNMYQVGGSGAAGVTCYIWANASGSPGTLLGTSGTVSGSSIGSSPGWVLFTFASPVNMTGNVLYWVGVGTTQSSYSAYYEMELGGYLTGEYMYSSDGSSWTLGSAYRGLYFEIFSQ